MRVPPRLQSRKVLKNKRLVHFTACKNRKSQGA